MSGGVRIAVAVVAATALAPALLPASPAPPASAAPATATAAATAATATPAIRVVPVDSSYETPTRAVSRDIGLSVALPDGHDLWVFGDTGTYVRAPKGAWKPSVFLSGSSALEARDVRGAVPHGGEYPSGVPSRFIAEPANVYLPGGTDRHCTDQTAAFPARWPTGLAVMPTNPSDLLVTYSEVCVTRLPGGAPSIDTEGWGYLLFNWRTHHVDHGPVDVFRPKRNGKAIADSLLFESPQFDNGRLVLFSSTCAAALVSCRTGTVWSTTVALTTAALDNPASYVPTTVATDDSQGWSPLSISVARFPSGWRLVEATSIAGGYAIYSAATLAGPWHFLRSGTLPGCPSRVAFCFGLQSHPELSTATSLFLSYKDPDSGPGGHVVVSAVAD